MKTAIEDAQVTKGPAGTVEGNGHVTVEATGVSPEVLEFLASASADEIPVNPSHEASTTVSRRSLLGSLRDKIAGHAETGRGNPTAPQARRFLLWLGAIVVIFNCIFAFWVIARPANGGRIIGGADVLEAAGPLLGALVYFAMSRRLKDRTGSALHKTWDLHAWSPTFLALGAVWYAVGQLIWSYYELVIHQAPFPSLADAGYLAAYPFLFLGILFLPVRRTSGAARARVLLDGIVIMAAVVTFSWYFVLGPTLLQGGEADFSKLVGTAYPLCDLGLVFCLLLLAGQSGSSHLRRAIWTLSLGLLAVVCADIVFDYKNLHGTYETGGLSDLGWPLGFMLICLGALAARVDGARQVATARESTGGTEDISPRSPLPAWYSLAPYALVPLVGGLMVYVGHVGGNPAVDPGVYVGGAVLIGLVLVRQILMILENRQLSREMAKYASLLHATQRDLQVKNNALDDVNIKLQEVAKTDPITGLPNHRALVAWLDHELERAHRYQSRFSLLFMDIDHFKALNDTRVHSAGDDALREFGSVTRAALRDADVLGRWGGEEFVAILPETDPGGAIEVAERLRSQVADVTREQSGGYRLTCSIGVAHFPGDGSDRNSLIENADRAMYAAKRLGRNQVRLTTDPEVAELDLETSMPRVRGKAVLSGA